MPNETQPILSVGSNNRICRSNITFVGSIVAIILTAFACIACFPFICGLDWGCS